MSESEEEPDYSDMEESEEDEQSDFEGDPTAELDSRRAQFEVLSLEQLRDRQAEALQQTATVTMLPDDEATRVLRHFNWDAQTASQSYFGDMNGVRGKLGLVRDPDALPEPPAPSVSPTEAGPGRRTRGGARARVVQQQRCPICFDDFDPGALLAGPCGHGFCKDCWRGYAAGKVGEGPAILDVRCPQPDCTAAPCTAAEYLQPLMTSTGRRYPADGLIYMAAGEAPGFGKQTAQLQTPLIVVSVGSLSFQCSVPRGILDEVLQEDELAKVDNFALRSFVEDSKHCTWCPSPGCSFAVHSSAHVEGEAQDITCLCGATFCFTCKEEAHRPVDCPTVSKWILKNSAESENLNWILANTKPCPKCRRPIEKNHGCMHMSCSQCRHEFCWLCLGNWKEHGEGTGGFYNCNRYEQGKRKGNFSKEEAQREHAKQSLERYMHYYERFAENDKARKKAASDRAKFLREDIEKLSERQSTPTSLLKLITDAWDQVIDCRRVLKWTYAYGFYAFDLGDTIEDEYSNSLTAKSHLVREEREQRIKNQKDFFEFSQGQAEKFLEQLHKMVEAELEPFHNPDMQAGAAPSPSDWEAYKSRLISITAITLDHFRKLVSELDAGMDALAQRYGADEASAAAKPPALSISYACLMPGTAGAGAQTGDANMEGSSPVKRSRSAKRSHVASQRAAAATAASTRNASQDGPAEFWACQVCTYVNDDMGATACSMCETAREGP